ncbi:ImmA/IrrE family metallo-endopeptidase [Amycolatopsis pigmentata]|uniref:ImmA/IrrE family metallo-endopeptidase n=1 Tax=Amycolatopsis pigmentata TaxID=450801 RepID=A0ABW5FKL5_9PSEU
MPISPTRLALARKLRGLTLAELGRLTGLSPQTINRYEKARQEPLPENMAAVAHALNLPVEFFERPEIEPIPLAAASFRAPTKTPAFRRDAVLAAGTIATEIAAWITERYRLPGADIPSLHLPVDATWIDVETTALRVRGRWDLGHHAIPNMVHLLESRGARVFSLVQDVRDVDAFSAYLRNEPFVFIDTGKTAERQRFDAAHELGHLVMHQGPEKFDGRQAERQADRFAAAFLMPKEDVLARNLRDATPDELIKASTRWGVSAMALTHRLSELGVLTEWGYRSTCVELAKRGYRRAEPGSTRVPETSQVLEKVFAHLRSSGVGVRSIATTLAITDEEFNRHVFGLAKLATTNSAGTPPHRRSRSHLRVVPTSAATSNGQRRQAK